MTTATEPRQELVLLEPRDRAALDVERAALLADVDAAMPSEIADHTMYLAVAALELRVDRFIARVEPLFDQHCQDAYRVWKSACGIRAMFLDGPKAIKTKARALLGAFVKREAEERREQERIIAEQERQREIDRNQRDAQLLDSQGQPEIAAAVRAQPVDAPAVSLPSAVPDVAGLTYRDDWFWHPAGGDSPVNRRRALAMLVKDQYLEFVTLNDAGLTAFAKRTKGTIKVPGIVFGSRKVPVRR